MICVTESRGCACKPHSPDHEDALATNASCCGHLASWLMRLSLMKFRGSRSTSEQPRETSYTWNISFLSRRVTSGWDTWCYSLIPSKKSKYKNINAGPYGEPPADMVCGGSFQVCGIQASGFQVTLADVFVPERWSACWSDARGELTIHDVLRNPAILHSGDMAEPA